MSQRRKFNSGLKFKVVLDALGERYSLQELAKKHSLHPNRISAWNREFMKNGAEVFGKEKTLELSKAEFDGLYKVIGQQKIEIDF